VNKQVLQSDVEAQQNVAPFLKHRVLREIVKSFTNSPNDDFEAWAKNQQAIDTLKEASACWTMATFQKKTWSTPCWHTCR